MTNCVHDHGRWGAGDQLGAAHFLTPENTLAALAQVKLGLIYDMSQVIENGAPRIAPVQSPYYITTSNSSANGVKRRRALGATNEPGANLERIEMTTHVGTHIDALGHYTIGDRMYGGHSAEDTVDDWGLLKLGIEQAPAFVTRGVAVDVSGLDGGGFLEAGRAVGKDDVRRALDQAGVELRAGDVFCLNTGWGRFFMIDNRRYVAGEPGLDREAAEWLTAQDVAAIGADNMAVEAIPGARHPEVMMPVHQHCLAEAGVYLIENLVIDGVLAAGLNTFCFVLLPVKFKGATGCPVRPIAMV